MAPPPPQAADRPGSDAPRIPDDLPLEDLAKILDSDAELDGEAHARLARLFRADPRCTARIAELDALAREAGLPDAPWTALYLSRRLDRLLEDDRWQDPVEALAVPDSETACLAELIRLAEVRAFRSDEPGRFLAVRERLIEAEVMAFEEAFKPFVRRLLPLSPEGAGRVLVLASMIYQGTATSLNPR